MAAMTMSLAAPVACSRATSLAPALPKAARPVAFAKIAKNGAKTTCFKIWTPIDNKFFETFSFLPALTDDQIAKQIDYIVGNGWVPCLEFAMTGDAYVDSRNCVRFGAVASGYQDNRYWTMWKLPMFGCTDPSQVLSEIQKCNTTFPDAYVRLVAFDNVRQVQITGFLVHRPPSATEYRTPDQRSVGN